MHYRTTGTNWVKRQTVSLWADGRQRSRGIGMTVVSGMIRNGCELWMFLVLIHLGYPGSRALKEFQLHRLYGNTSMSIFKISIVQCNANNCSAFWCSAFVVSNKVGSSYVFTLSVRISVCQQDIYRNCRQILTIIWWVGYVTDNRRQVLSRHVCVILHCSCITYILMVMWIMMQIHKFLKEFYHCEIGVILWILLMTQEVVNEFL